MKRINFKEFEMPEGISGKTVTKGDVRESFADVLYNKCNGIRAKVLAEKIYKSDGAVEYEDDEVAVISNIANAECTPRFIAGLEMQLNAQAEAETK